ncbi:hypothetical protein F8388_000531 [Cannabis sativa]|uniref:Uncharacterized protein n=1 Tax=Cannabis sativa TaxID=3483 RepID=A0A7J6EZT1_CANSA|nr:hypothetical protein G4B88_025049 [Cannabis sativa]KAF4363866.1 hypothetical protein F8388_000531 [Cannabis sativa]
MAEKLIGTTVRAPAYNISNWFSTNNPNPNPNQSRNNLSSSASNSDRRDRNQDHNNVVINDHNRNNSTTTKKGQNDVWVNIKRGLLVNLEISSELETKIGEITKQILIKNKSSSPEEGTIRLCSCGGAKVISNFCKNCVLSQISNCLRNNGGEHKFIDVVEENKNINQDVRVIIEVNLRSEFELGTKVSSEEYKELVQLIPELYIGKAERLKMVINVMCFAAEKCIEQKKMHLAPWRTYSYMCDKWLGPYKRDTSSSFLPDINALLLSKNNNIKTNNNTRIRQRMISMLTMELLELQLNNNKNINCSNDKPLALD